MLRPWGFKREDTPDEAKMKKEGQVYVDELNTLLEHDAILIFERHFYNVNSGRNTLKM